MPLAKLMLEKMAAINRIFFNRVYVQSYQYKFATLKLGFPIGIPLRAIARNGCVRLRILLRAIVL